jgi:hypothetical protein
VIRRGREGEYPSDSHLEEEGSMGTWTARAPVSGDPDDVLAVLTDPEAASRWSPVGFDVEQLEGDRLSEGARAVLSGRLAGRRIEFEVQVCEARDGRLALAATGPVDLDVRWGVVGGELEARVDVHEGRGLAGRILSSATEALLRAGSLERAAASVAREAEHAPLALAA